MNFRRFFDFRESPDDAKPFLDHIEDLRIMIIKMIATVMFFMMLCFAFRIHLTALVQWPLESVAPYQAEHLQSLGVADSFTISLELAFYGGIVFSFPFLLLFLAEFVLPALTPKEKRMLYPVAFAGFGLFLGGITFAYFLVIPRALAFFFKDAESLHWHPTWTVREYYSFTTQFLIAFGLAMELPLVVLALVKLGIIDVGTLRRTRAYAVIAIVVFAAVIAPTPDVFTLLLLAGPMYLLYEGCIGVAWLLDRKSTE